MSMPMEDVQPIDDLEPTIFDMFWVDAFKPKLCHEKDILVVTFFATHPQDAEELSRHIVRCPANIVSVEASADPDEDGFYIVIVELDRQKEMFNELTVMLETIQPLVQLDNWYFKPFDYDDYFQWNERNFTDTVPQDPEAFEAQQVDIFVTAEPDDLENDDRPEPFSQHAVEDGSADLSTFSRSLNTELRKQFSHLIKLNQRLMRKFDQLQTDHKYLQRQLQLYQKREKLALTRERQDLQRIRRLEGELSMLAYSSMNRQDVVIDDIENRTDVLAGRQALQGSHESKIYEADDVTPEPAANDRGQSPGDRYAGPEVDTDHAVAMQDVESESLVDQRIDNGQRPDPDDGLDPTDPEEVIDLEDPLYSDAASETASGTNSDDPLAQNRRREATMEATGRSGADESDHVSALETVPADDQSPFALGMAALKAKHYDAAIDYFSNVEEDSEDAPRGFYNLAVLYYMRRNYEAANRYAELALAGGILSAEQILEFSRNKQQAQRELIQAQAGENGTPVEMDESGNTLQDAADQSAVGDVLGRDRDRMPGAESVGVSDADLPVDDTAHTAGQPVESGHSDSDEDHIIELDASTEISEPPTTDTSHAHDMAADRSAEATATDTDPTTASHSALEAESDLDAYYYALGQAALEKGDIPVAIDYFSAVEKSAHQAPTSRYYLAILYMRSNLYDQARLRAVEAREMGVARAQKILDLIEKRSVRSSFADRPGLESEASDKPQSATEVTATPDNASVQTDMAQPPSPDQDAVPYQSEEKFGGRGNALPDTGVGVDDSDNALSNPIEGDREPDTAEAKADPLSRPPAEPSQAEDDTVLQWRGDRTQVPGDIEKQVPVDGTAGRKILPPNRETAEPAPVTEAAAMDDQTDPEPQAASEIFQAADQSDQLHGTKIEPEEHSAEAESRPVQTSQPMPEEDVPAPVAAGQKDPKIAHKGQKADNAAGGAYTVSGPSTNAVSPVGDGSGLGQEEKEEYSSPAEEKTMSAETLPKEDAADKGSAIIENAGSSRAEQGHIETQNEPAQAVEELTMVEPDRKDKETSTTSVESSSFREEQADAPVDQLEPFLDQTAKQSERTDSDDTDQDIPPSTGPDAGQQVVETTEDAEKPGTNTADIDDEVNNENAGQAFSDTENDPKAELEKDDSEKPGIARAALPARKPPTIGTTDAAGKDPNQTSPDRVATQDEKEDEIGADAGNSLTAGHSDIRPGAGQAADRADTAASSKEETDDSSLADVYEALVGSGDEGDLLDGQSQPSQDDTGTNSDAPGPAPSADTAVHKTASIAPPESEHSAGGIDPFEAEPPAASPESPDMESGAAMTAAPGGKISPEGPSKQTAPAAGQLPQTQKTTAPKADTATFDGKLADSQTENDSNGPVVGQGAGQAAEADPGGIGSAAGSDSISISRAGTEPETVPEPAVAKQATAKSTVAPDEQVPEPPKPLDHYALGKRAIKEKKYKQAIKHLSTIAKKAPEAPKAQYMLGALYYRMKRPEEAASHAQLALDMGVAKARDLLNKIKDDMLRAIAAKKAAATAADEQKEKGAKKKKAKAARTRSGSIAEKSYPSTGEFAPEEAFSEDKAADQTAQSVPEDAAVQAESDGADAFSDYPDLSGDGVDDYLNQFQDAPPDNEFQATETFVASDAYDFFNDDPIGDTYGDTTFDRLIEGQPDHASEPAGQAQAEEPDYFALGLENLDKKKYADALENFLDARKQKPDDPRVQYSLAVTYYRMYNYEDARQCAREAYRGGVKAAKKVLRKIERHKKESKRGETAGTATAVAAAAESKTTAANSEAGAMPVDLTAEADMDDAATTSISDSIVWGPNDLEGEAVNPEDTLSGEKTQPAAKGEVMVFDSVSDLQSKVAKQTETAGTADSAGDESESGGQLDLEATDFDMAPPPRDLAAAPDRDDVKKYLALGQKAVDKKDYLRAIKHFTKITELLPKDPLGFYNLAIISYRLNYFTTAKAHAGKALELGFPAANKILRKIESKQS